MQENFELVQCGFRTLLISLSGYIGQELNRVYQDRWWNEVLSALSDQRNLPYDGTYSELVDSLDVANCFRIIDRKWRDVFIDRIPLNCRTWSKELMGVRNIVAHLGPQDLDQPTAERALDTMALLCAEIDPDSAEEIREVYREVRARATDSIIKNVEVPFTGLAQPESDSKRGGFEGGESASVGRY